jgi:hypothetical protein
MEVVMTEATRELNVLFSGEEVKVGDGVVTVSPLPLSKLPKVIEAFSSLMKRAQDGITPQELAMQGLTDILKILPFCVDVDPDDIPAYAVPDILEKVIEQNISDATVGKWKALIPKMTDMFSLKENPVAGQSEKKASGKA